MKPVDDLPHGANGGGCLANAAKQIHSVISDPEQHFTQPASVKTINLDLLDYKNGALKLANAATPEYETTPALFSTRYQPTTVSLNYLITTPTMIDGCLTDKNFAKIWFEVLPHQTYEIYKNNTLQAVINNKSGIYTYIDKNTQSNNIYCVKASLNGENVQSSNQLELRLPNKNTKDPKVTKAVENKHIPWYF